MGLFDFLLRLLGLKPARGTKRPPSRKERRRAAAKRRGPVRLAPLRASPKNTHPVPTKAEEVPEIPYRFAQLGVYNGGYLDLNYGGDDQKLLERQLPVLHVPEELANWLQMPIGKVAWLIDRFATANRPDNEPSAHYFYRWMRKRSGGWRLIEAPKPTLRRVQTQILTEILNKVPPHPRAHGFVPHRSIVTNAQPHVGKRILVKFDLENFYATVTFNRVVAIFRSLGYNREAATWLARLTTSALPQTIRFPDNDASAILPFLRRHLPQGAPTSPALANLSAYSLDVRLSGLARSFGAEYTRYADDLTFSGPDRFRRALPVFIPLVKKIIREERFRVHRTKRKVVRNNQRQLVTGVVVNQRTNLSRAEYDRLKAILHNCVRYGPLSQNRENHPDFAAHLRGRVAHAAQLHPERGAKLLALYQQIDWLR